MLPSCSTSQCQVPVAVEVSEKEPIFLRKERKGKEGKERNNNEIVWVVPPPSNSGNEGL